MFDMKYHFLHEFRISTPFKEKSSDEFKDLYKLKLLTNFDVNLTSLLGGVANCVQNISFITPARNDIKLPSKFVRSSHL